MTPRSSLARGAGRWFTNHLPWTTDPVGSGPWYSPARSDVVPNVTALSSAFLARLSAWDSNAILHQRSLSAARRVLAEQLHSGLWTLPERTT